MTIVTHVLETYSNFLWKIGHRSEYRTPTSYSTASPGSGLLCVGKLGSQCSPAAMATHIVTAVFRSQVLSILCCVCEGLAKSVAGVATAWIKKPKFMSTGTNLLVFHHISSLYFLGK